MSQQLTDALRALADDLEAGVVGPVPERVWRAGSRRRWRRRGAVGLAMAAVVVVVALVVAPGDSLSTLPAGRDSEARVTAYPQRIGQQWFTGTFHAGDGPVALLIERVAHRGAEGDEDLGWFAVSPGGHQRHLDIGGYGMPTVSPDGRWVGYWAGPDQGYLLQGTSSERVVRFSDVPDPQMQLPSYWNARGDRVFVPSGGSSGDAGVVLGLDGTEVVVPRSPGTLPYGWWGDDVVALDPKTAGSGTDFTVLTWRPVRGWGRTETLVSIPGWGIDQGLDQFTASMAPDGSRMSIVVPSSGGDGTREVRAYALPAGAPVPDRWVDPTTARVYTDDLGAPSRDAQCPVTWRSGVPLSQLPGNQTEGGDAGLVLGRWRPSGKGEPITVSQDGIGVSCMLWATSALEGTATWSVFGTSTSWVAWWWREVLLGALVVAVVVVVRRRRSGSRTVVDRSDD